MLPIKPFETSKICTAPGNKRQTMWADQPGVFKKVIIMPILTNIQAETSHPKLDFGITLE